MNTYSFTMNFIGIVILTIAINFNATAQFSGGNGSPSDPYVIEDWTHFNEIRNHLQDHFLLSNDLDMNTNGYDLLGPAQEWLYNDHSSPVMAIASEDTVLYSGELISGAVHRVENGIKQWEYSAQDFLKSLAVDKNGNVYVGHINNGLHKVNSQGSHEWTYSGHGGIVMDVVVDGSGYSFSGDDVNNEVHKVDDNGNFVWSYTFNSIVKALAVNQDGYVYVGGGSNEVHKLDHNGSFLWSYTHLNGSVEALATDDLGNVYSADRNNEVHKIDSNGNQKWVYSGHSSYVHGIEVAESGYIFTASDDNEVHKLNSEGELMWYYDHGGKVNDVTVDKNGYVYSAGDNTEIHKISYGWKPVSGNFEGVFNGDENIIYDLSIIHGQDNAGIFELIHENGAVENLNLINFSVSQQGNHDYIGAIAGENKGKISNVGVSGRLIKENGNYAGGIAGKNSGTIEKSYVRDIKLNCQGNVQSTGGITGFNNTNGLISESFATGNIKTGGDQSGGIAGVNQGEIKDVFAHIDVLGNPSGSKETGGLVGKNGPGSIENSYSTGKVTGDVDVGGLIGFNDQGSVNSSYWDENSSGVVISDGGTGKQTIEMQDNAQANLSGWDFSETWEVANSGMYPGLRTIKRSFRMSTDGAWEEPGNWEQKFPGALWEDARISPLNAHEIEIDKEAEVQNNIELSAEKIELNSKLEFKGGNLVFNDGVLIIADNGEFLGEQKGSYYIGTLQITRDANNGTNFGGTGAELSNVSGSPGDVKLTRTSGPGSAIIFQSNEGINRFWEFEPSGSLNSADLTLDWVEDDDNLKNINNVQVWKNEDGEGEWTAVGNKVSADAGNGLRSVTSAINSFSYYTVSDENSPLPVEWLDFSVQLEENSTRVEWSTASEINNDYFLVQRRTNNSDWENINQEQGQGNSPVTTHYRFHDREVYQLPDDLVYYRIKQVDFDGTYEYSPIRYIRKKSVQETDWEVFPNPFNENLYARFEAPRSIFLEGNVYNLQGDEVMNFKRKFDAGQHKTDIGAEMENLDAGTYLLLMKLGTYGKMKSFKIIKE